VIDIAYFLVQGAVTIQKNPARHTLLQEVKL
jgi:hypothetical protein